MTQALPLSPGREKHWCPSSRNSRRSCLLGLSGCFSLPPWSMSHRSHPWIQCAWVSCSMNLERHSLIGDLVALPLKWEDFYCFLLQI